MPDTVRNRAGHVLLAEDDPVSVTVARAMLANLDVGVDVVGDGAAAVRAATQKRYHAILLDCQLPVLDGYQAATEIRRLQSSARRTPIIAVTATPVRDGQEDCLNAGMDDYLVKPYNLKALAAMLVRWTQDRSLRTGAVEQAKPLPTVQLSPNQDDGTSGPVLDPAIIGRLERLGEAAGDDLMAQLSSLFLADARVRLAAMRQALTQDDVATVARSAHMLSGASANLGAVELSRLCATLALSGIDGNLVCGPLQLDAVQLELDRVRLALRSPTRES
jgi:CheY-like chemotaxis protein